MKAFLILAEAATGHPDKTFSVLRAGINRVWGERAPFFLNCMLVAKIETGVSESGKLPYEIRCTDEAGEPIIPTIGGELTAASSESVNLIMAPLSIAFPKTGRFAFELRVAGISRDTLAVSVTTDPPK